MIIDAATHWPPVSYSFLICLLTTTLSVVANQWGQTVTAGQPIGNCVHRHVPSSRQLQKDPEGPNKQVARNLSADRLEQFELSVLYLCQLFKPKVFSACNGAQHFDDVIYWACCNFNQLNSFSKVIIGTYLNYFKRNPAKIFAVSSLQHFLDG